MTRIAFLFFALHLSLVPSLAQDGIPSDSRMKVLRDQAVIRIGYRTDATPFSFVREAGEPVGYSIDLCRQIVDVIGRELGNNLSIEWVPVTLRTRFSMLKENKADMECGASTVSLRRMEEVDFSNLVFVDSTTLIVRRQSEIRSFSEMNGRKIAAISGTSNERAIADQIARRHLEGASVVPVASREEGLSALERGAVDAYASDKLLLVGAAKQNPSALELLPDELSFEPYAVALPRGDWAFRLAVNRALAQIYRSGAQYPIFEKWFERIGLRPSTALGMAWMLATLAE